MYVILIHLKGTKMIPNKKYIKQLITVGKITNIISKHTGIPDDADNIIEAAEEIYEALVGKLNRKRIDP